MQTQKKFMNRPWWSYAGLLIKRKIMLVGFDDDETIFQLSSLSKDISVLNLPPEECEINSLTQEDFRGFEGRYDLILVDGLKSNVRPHIISYLFKEFCATDGMLLFLSYNESYFGNKKHEVTEKLFKRFISPKESPDFKGVQTSLIRQLKLHIRDCTPRFSYRPGCYHSNKNSFLVKEKIKKYIFNSYFSRFIHNGNIWVIGNVRSPNNLESIIIEKLTEKGVIEGRDNYSCINTYYKLGKVIQTFASEHNITVYIVVVTLNEISFKQRMNEFEAIKVLSENATLRPLISNDIKKFSVDTFNCFVMKEFEGVTVDIESRWLEVMTNNSALAIELVGRETIAEFNAEDVRLWINKYTNSILERLPSTIRPVTELGERIISLAVDLNLPMVCMHGDAKLENFVLNDNHEVEAIIDWELCQIEGFPLLDIFYLITYNYHVIKGYSFVKIFRKLWNENLKDSEIKIIKRYRDAIKLDHKQQSVLLLVFLLHHYSERFLISERHTAELALFKELLEDVLSDKAILDQS